MDGAGGREIRADAVILTEWLAEEYTKAWENSGGGVEADIEHSVIERIRDFERANKVCFVAVPESDASGG